MILLDFLLAEVALQQAFERFSMPRLITGAVELNDANWQAYLNNWKSMGGADVLKSYVDAYNKLNNTAYEPAL